MNQCLVSSFFSVFTQLALLLALPVLGQQNTSPASAPVLKVENEVQKPLTLSRTDLDKMPQVKVKGKDHDGREHVFKGVPVAALLRQAGVTIGGQLRGKPSSTCWCRPWTATRPYSHCLKLTRNLPIG